MAPNVQKAVQELTALRTRFSGFVDGISLVTEEEDMNAYHDVEGTLYNVIKLLDQKG